MACLLQELAHPSDGNRTLADGRGHSLHGAAADVADREYASARCLERRRPRL